MKKKVQKITAEQTNKIKSLAREGRSALEIKAITRIPLHIVRYHVERVKIAQAEGKLSNKESTVKLLDGRVSENIDYKRVLDDLDRTRKVVESLMMFH